MDNKRKEDLLENGSLEIKLKQYYEKNEILNKYCKKVTAEELYTHLFGTLDIEGPFFFKDRAGKDNNKGTNRIYKLEEAIKEYKNTKSISVCACRFYKNKILMQFINDVYAIVIDADSVTSKRLDSIFQNGFELKLSDTKTHKLPKPTYIVNSGTGIHLYYVFNEPIPYFKKQSNELNKLYKMMAHDLTADHHFGMKEQILWIGQPYRMVGSLTKIDTETTAFMYGDEWNIDELANWYGITTKFERRKNIKMEISKDTFREISYNNTKTEVNNEVFIETPITNSSIKKITAIPKHTNIKFYDSTFKGIKEKTTCGHRYYSMVALCAVAKKCQITKDRLENDLSELADYFNLEAKNNGTPLIEDDEVRNALKSFKEIGKKNTRVTLENWLGWKYDAPYRKDKKVRRSREAHLKRARALLQLAIEAGEVNPAKKADKYRAKVEQILINIPTAKKCDVIRETGFDKKTVYKYYDEIKAGISSDK